MGAITRGTTNPNRLRRCDRWLTGPQAWRLRQTDRPPVAIDLGFGASPVTAVELHQRLRRVRADAQVVGLEIDLDRVRAALPLERPGLTFRHGGFEIPVPGQVEVVRAFNVLRQYDESQVRGAWDRVRERLAPRGLLVDGTCDEIGRLSSWIAVDHIGPISLTISVRLAGLEDPSIVAERLPKALIHRNVPGERIHQLLRDLGDAWAHASPHAAYGARQRFIVTARTLRDAGWPVLDGPHRWRLGELGVAWHAVAPRP
ncbi:class I SAM-dependent methyltransferase [Leekyejoonella antrihumi]|uniref:Class I SAM-dependent methyltransferase n=1 Tax=Leekyejoonella antrihumi TaxID=1660198 RepID=A0A563E9E7_9MICO|nr:class I SAM-dependent methyltransferase [Leekyejoonella antrihumi]